MRKPRFVLNRPNLLLDHEEYWRPPLFKPIKGRWDHLRTQVRGFFDIPTGSTWRDLRQLLPQFQGLVVDVGCGAQPYRSLLHPRATYQGIDQTDAVAHFGYSLPATIYYEGDRWPIEDASVDLVLSTETLEHVPKPAVFLSEAFRCLRPGGSLILAVPFAARWHFIPRDYWRFTPSGLQLLLSEARFIDIAVHARGNALTVACYKVMALCFPLLLPQSQGFWKRVMLRAFGLLTLPIVTLLAIIANATLTRPWGDDCLGYTAIAKKPD
jgi:SAM-dependent methyltransferase